MDSALVGTALIGMSLAPGGIAGKFTAEMEKIKASAGATASGITPFGQQVSSLAGSLLKIGVVGGGALVGIGLASVKAAATFQQSMAMIHTQAGATGEDLASMGQALLDMSVNVGTSADDLAQSLYHIESAGFRGKAALDAVQASAKLAVIGQANLEDTTQAVIGVMAAYPQYAGRASDATAILNAIVGTGDMKMEGLARAMATGILPAAQNVKLGLVDVGAALATLTDNVTPPDEAATRLRMTFSLLEHQSGPAAKALESIGIKSGQLGQDLVKPNGLLVAIQDLHDHLAKTFGAGAVDDLNHYVSIMQSQGVDAANKYAQASSGAARVVLEAFGGGRTSAAIETLLGEFDRFKSKYPAIIAGAKGADDAWTETKKNFAFQVDQAKAAIQKYEIEIGQRLMPIATDLLKKVLQALPTAAHLAGVAFDDLGTVFHFLGEHMDLIRTLIELWIARMVAVKALNFASSILQIANAFRLLATNEGIGAAVSALQGGGGLTGALRNFRGEANLAIEGGNGFKVAAEGMATSAGTALGPIVAIGAALVAWAFNIDGVRDKVTTFFDGIHDDAQAWSDTQKQITQQGSQYWDNLDTSLDDFGKKYSDQVGAWNTFTNRFTGDQTRMAQTVNEAWAKTSDQGRKVFASLQQAGQNDIINGLGTALLRNNGDIVASLNDLQNEYGKLSQKASQAASQAGSLQASALNDYAGKLNEYKGHVATTLNEIVTANQTAAHKAHDAWEAQQKTTAQSAIDAWNSINSTFGEGSKQATAYLAALPKAQQDVINSLKDVRDKAHLTTDQLMGLGSAAVITATVNIHGKMVTLKGSVSDIATQIAEINSGIDQMDKYNAGIDAKIKQFQQLSGWIGNAANNVIDMVNGLGGLVRLPHVTPPSGPNIPGVTNNINVAVTNAGATAGQIAGAIAWGTHP